MNKTFYYYIKHISYITQKLDKIKIFLDIWS